MPTKGQTSNPTVDPTNEPTMLSDGVTVSPSMEPTKEPIYVGTDGTCAIRMIIPFWSLEMRISSSEYDFSHPCISSYKYRIAYFDQTTQMLLSISAVIPSSWMMLMEHVNGISKPSIAATWIVDQVERS